MSVHIHSTAIVDPNAELGVDVTVGPYAVVHANVVIGDRSAIDSHAVVLPYTRMGTDNQISSHALIGGQPQDLKFRGEISWLELGNNNVIREFATLHRGTEGGGGITRLGDHNLCMAYTHVAHDCQLGSHIVMSNNATLAGHVSVDDHAILGGLSAVHQFVRVGRHAFVGGMTGIAQDVPPWMLVSGARGLIQGPNMVGLRRFGAGRNLVMAVKDVHRILWRSGLARLEALTHIEEKYGEVAEISEFIDFVRHSERGICAAAKNDEIEA